MAAKPFIAARIPEELNLKLEDYSKTTSESRTQILINALSAYIGYSQTQEGSSNSSDRLSQLEERVADLEQLLKEVRLPPSPNEREEESKEQNTVEVQVDNNADNNFDNSGQEKETVQGVIGIDNDIDNAPDNKSDNILDNVQTTILDEVLIHPDAQYGEYLGQMKTPEVMALPVLKEMDKTKLRNKLGGVRRISARRVKIGPYLLFLTLVDKGNAKKQEYLWDVYKTENIPITGDNS